MLDLPGTACNTLKGLFLIRDQGVAGSNPAAPTIRLTLSLDDFILPMGSVAYTVRNA